MIAEGALDGVDFILGQHVLPLYPVGQVALSEGPALAAVDDVTMMKGTVRTFDPVLRMEIRKRIETLVDGIVRVFGAQYELEYTHHYAPTVNPSAGVSLMKQVASEVLGAENVHTMPPSMGGEDFGYFLRKVPGCFYWLGCRHPDVQSGYNLHHPGFDIDERALVHGVQLYVAGVLHVQQAPGEAAAGLLYS